MPLPLYNHTSNSVDTVIIGHGPSALILSYILSGHIPYYSSNHDDDLLHERISSTPDLLHIKGDVFSHLRSSLRYSSQALPVNVLLDALVRPDGDLSTDTRSCLKWRQDLTRVIPHKVFGNGPTAGGQWAEQSDASQDIGTLSYAEQLSLPGYTLADYWRATKHSEMPELIRPTRTDVAQYLAAYPDAVGISDRVQTSAHVEGISRTDGGFHIASHNVFCRHLVLASGTFNVNLPPPAPLESLDLLPPSSAGPVLVIGSGFTAADIISSTSPERQIIHLYHWDPENRPSPLKGCHSSAYPEYAGIYRQMRLAAKESDKNQNKIARSKMSRAKSSSMIQTFSQRDWATTYRGYPNAHIVSVNEEPGHIGSAESKAPQLCTITITGPTILQPVTRGVSEFHYAAGRRGTLSYLSPALLEEVLLMKSNLSSPTSTPSSSSSSNSLVKVRSHMSMAEADPWGDESSQEDLTLKSGRPTAKSSGGGTLISGTTLRVKLEDSETMEVAPKVFAIGSLTGDSLIRFALGGCCVAAGRIMDDYFAHGAEAYTAGDDEQHDKRDRPLDRRKSLHDVAKVRDTGSEHQSRDDGRTWSSFYRLNCTVS
ncbi:MAG: hypothetical protein M1831_002067 [Alyxoria varia]|nr:MAG: hypothetical protein M1831_002067 [Alyxoria varia]